jgi:flavin reductase (DIM6/NTAB) family NADH-FMN oxidoreductase RutF
MTALSSRTISPPPDTTTPDMTPTSDLFRQGMRRLAGACTIITSLAPGEGREGWTGMTATAVASVTADPAQLLVCINRSTWAHGIITRSQVLGVNVLGDDALALAGRFAGGVAPHEKFAQGAWLTAATGAPLLADALVSFDCRVAECIAASTHDIFICDVVDVLLRESGGDPLIYFDGAFLGDRQPPVSRNSQENQQ